MRQENVIIIAKEGVPIGAWGSIKQICSVYDFAIYSSIKAKKFPFKYKGYDFYKLPFRKK